MDRPNQTRSWTAPLLVAVLLLLPFTYVGSYLALVKPARTIPGRMVFATDISSDGTASTLWLHNYRVGGEWAGRFYWPLEQIDRKLFPGRWDLVLVYD